jgi:hypothetical protein
MCQRCDAPDRKYFVRDRLTELLVCEACGFAVADHSSSGYRKGEYIWRLNSNWPVFHSFDELTRQIFVHNQVRLPPCRPEPNTPSRLLTIAFDFLGRGVLSSSNDLH